MRRTGDIISFALCAAALLSCGGNEEDGTPYYYRVVMDVGGEGGGRVVDAQGLLTCSSRGGIGCPSPSVPGGEGKAADESASLADPRDAQLMPDGCDCTGKWTLALTGGGPDYLRFPGDAVYAGGAIGSAGGTLAIGYGAETCTGSLYVTKVGETASAHTGYHFPDIAGGFAVKCASFEVKKGLFYLIPEEASGVPGR